MNIAIIPARGGSKRIPRKNIKEFAGKPMIAHAITTALESRLFSHVVVSTDDDEIATIAREWGAEVPFQRPDSLADDITPTVPVIAHAVGECQTYGWDFEFACCIYPGVPFLRVTDLEAACTLMREKDSGYAHPVTEYPSAIQRALRLFPDGRTRPINPEYEWTRTQDLEPAYFDAGQFYWGRVSSWQSGLGLQSNGWGVPIPHWLAVDIDTNEDWIRAEIMLASGLKDWSVDE